MSGSFVGGRRRTALGVALACLTAAAGCRSGDKGEHRASGDGTKAQPEESQGPQRGGHIKLPSNEPRYTNPILETRFDMASGLIFEGLVGVDAKYEPVKRLAESWTMSDDGKVLTF